MFDWLPVFRFPPGLLIAPLVVLGVWWNQRAKARPAAIFSSLDGLRGLPVTLAQRLKRLLPLLRAAGLVCLAVAFARPQRGISETLVRTEGIAIEATLDISGSMNAMDFSINGERVSRIAAVRHVFAQFAGGDRAAGLSGRPNDAIGLVAFGGYANSRCPLTLDHSALLDVVKNLDTPKPIHDRRGNILNAELLQEELQTAIGDALALSVERLKDAKARSKIILLLTDGVNDAGEVSPEDAIALAKKEGIKIYTIGIGHTGEAPFPAQDFFGNQVLQPHRVEFDDKILKLAAEATGGKYFHAEDTDALRNVYASIDQLERSVTEKAVYMEYRELYAWPLAVGLALLLAEALLAATRFRTMP